VPPGIGFGNTAEGVVLVFPSLKSPYHGFLKMTVHVVWNIALRE